MLSPTAMNMLVRTNITVRFTEIESRGEDPQVLMFIFTCNCRFKIEGFEVVGDVADDVEENSWKVDSKDDAK